MVSRKSCNDCKLYARAPKLQCGMNHDSPQTSKCKVVGSEATKDNSFTSEVASYTSTLSELIMRNTPATHQQLSRIPKL